MQPSPAEGMCGGGLQSCVLNCLQMFISHNCSHVDNSASYGAAIAAGGRADLRLSNSSLSNNSADNTGGALYLLDTSVTLVTSCIISGNHAANSGGAGVFAGGISLLIINGDTKVQGNSAAFGGGVWASDLAQVRNTVAKEVCRKAAKHPCTTYTNVWAGKCIGVSEAVPAFLPQLSPLTEH